MQQTKSYYLVALFLIPVAGTFGHYIAPNEPIFKGQDWGIVVAYVLFVVAILLWIPQRWDFHWGKLEVAFLVNALILWTYQSARTQLDQNVFNLTAFLFPLALLLISLKKPSPNAVRHAYLAMLIGLIAISALSLISGGLGITLNGFYGIDSSESRIPVVSDLFGIENRWAGPFGSVNYAGPVGGLILISAFAFKGKGRLALCLGGLAILMLSQARTSIVAVLLAFLTLVLFSSPLIRSSRSTVYRTLLVASTASALFLYVLLIDPSLNGRTPIWSGFFGLFLDQPITGVGYSGVANYISLHISDPGFIPHNHAHSIYLDIAARFGLPALLLTLSLLAITLWVSWQNRGLDAGTSLALCVYIFIAGIAETIFSWQYITIYFFALLFINFGQRTRGSALIHA